MSEEVTIHTLLRDPIYRSWLKKVPVITVLGASPPWRVWVHLDDGHWAKKDFAKYVEAYNWMVRNYKKHADVIITCKRQEFRPPVVKDQWNRKKYWPMPKDHWWCGYCRRPTQFAVFKKHHAIRVTDFTAARCKTCGVRLDFLKTYYGR